MLRRIDCVLADTKQAVLKRNAQIKGKLDNPDDLLRKTSGYAFYNTSLYDFEKLLQDAPNLAKNLRNYLAGFSPNMREVLEKFDFDGTITELDEAGVLFLVLERFKNVDLHPSVIDNHTMGTVFEELIRKFNEAMTENTRVEEGSGNIFADLGLPDAEELLSKAALVLRIGEIIRGRNMTQAQAAQILGASQPVVSNLLNGRISGFSLERLVRFLNALDRDVEIVVKPRSRSRGRAGVRVRVSG